jgi:type II secretory ATPase GspE/PulE/Tfp pilus assembly ATPase PilB-like protein
LHTNDAPGAVARLLDMGIEPFLLASALTLIGAQRLVRRVCPHCSGAKCHLCNRTGYAGRIGVYEIMPVTEGIRGLITAKRETAAIREMAVKEGMQGLREDGMAKLQEGLTTLEEVIRETA